ncbi:hypothetical protein ACWDE0_40875 [Streptomyces sp. 900105755]
MTNARARRARRPTWSPTCGGGLTGDRDQDPDIVCTVHGGFDDVDQEADDHDQDDDPEGRTDLKEQYAETVRA